MEFSADFLDGLLLATVMLDGDPTSELGDDLAGAWTPYQQSYRSLSQPQKHLRVREALARLRPGRLSPPRSQLLPDRAPPLRAFSDDPSLTRLLEYYHHLQTEAQL